MDNGVRFVRCKPVDMTRDDCGDVLNKLMVPRDGGADVRWHEVRPMESPGFAGAQQLQPLSNESADGETCWRLCAAL